MTVTIQEWIEAFPWESETQKKGFQNFMQFLQKLPSEVKQAPGMELPCAVAYFIQKDHESHEWWVDMMSKQIEMLQQEIAELKKRLPKQE
jgi:hypothetical protein